MNWIKDKPDFKEECLLITASCCRGQWEYKLWEIMKVEVDEGWYMGIYEDGEEWGDLADLKADLYLTMLLTTDESPSLSSAEEAIEFAQWTRNDENLFSYKHGVWTPYPYTDYTPNYTTTELYNLYKQSKK